jgi:hypothetical protein
MLKAMNNLVNAAATVTLDGRTLTIRYRALAFIRYAEETDSDLLADIREIGALGQGIQSGGAGAGKLFAKVRDILWAGLLHEQPEFTRDETARLFGLDDMPTLMPAIVSALRGSLPEAADNGARPTKAAAKARRRDGRSTDGSGSGPSSATAAASALPSSAT